MPGPRGLHQDVRSGAEELSGGHDDSYLLPVGLDEREDESSVHDGQKVIQEEGQAVVQPLYQLQVLIRETGQGFKVKAVHTEVR